jgi:hypothetical protein
MAPIGAFIAGAAAERVGVTATLVTGGLGTIVAAWGVLDKGVRAI